jgi:predicted ATP-binding protein involved in virulence
MRIISLHSKNIGLFDNLDVKFNERFNFIVGPNASGKTSIIRNIALALDAGSIKDFRFRESPQVWIDFIIDSQINRVGFDKDWVSNMDNYQSAQLKSWNKPPVESNVKSYCSHELENSKIYFAPLFIGAFRKISYKRINGMTRDETSVKQRAEYRSSISKTINGDSLPDVKQWMINRYFQIEKDWANNEKKNWDWLLKNLSNLGPIGSNFNFIEIKRDLEPIFTVYGKNCFLEELSAGYQAILSIIFCIFDWIEGVNENQNMLVKNAEGTVLIDELDAHLHPEWQLTIRNSLDKLFPKLQFIITTHSPHIVASAKPNELLIIPENDGTIDIKPTSKTFSGWNTDQILEELMGVKGLENKLYSKLINEALENIEQNNEIALEKSISKLKKITHSSDTIVSSFEIKLAELKLSSHD